MNPVQKVVLGFGYTSAIEVKAVAVKGLGNTVYTVLEGLAGETLRVTLSNGKRINIELFEREPGIIGINCDGGQLKILPGAANSIQVGHG